MSSQKAISDRKLRKTQEIEEAAILNFQTTAVVDFQMATRSPSFTHLLKNIFKLFLTSKLQRFSSHWNLFRSTLLPDFTGQLLKLQDLTCQILDF